MNGEHLEVAMGVCAPGHTHDREGRRPRQLCLAGDSPDAHTSLEIYRAHTAWALPLRCGM